MIGLASAILTSYLPKSDQQLASVELSWQESWEECGRQLNTGRVQQEKVTALIPKSLHLEDFPFTFSSVKSLSSAAF